MFRARPKTTASKVPRSPSISPSRSRSRSPEGREDERLSSSSGHDFSQVPVENETPSSDEDFEIDPEAEAEEMLRDAKDEKDTAPRGATARSNFWRSGFAASKKLNTRDDLMKRQGFKVTGKGTAEITGGITGKPVKLRQHIPKSKKKESRQTPVYVEDRSFEGEPHQPDIDHEIDVLALEKAYEKDEVFSQEVSEAEEDTLKHIMYNHQPNLRIASKEGHKGEKRTFRSDTLPQRLIIEGKKMWSEQRSAQKKLKPDDYFNDFRGKRRSTLEKKAKKKPKPEDEEK